MSRLPRIIAALLLLTAIFEIRAGFTGRYAFVRKPTLVLAPMYAPGLDEDEISRVRTLLEMELAAEGTHALYPKSLIENFYLERDNATGIFDGSFRGKDDAFELGKSLGVERIATASILRYSKAVNVDLVIYDVATDQVVVRVSLESPNFESLLNWKDTSGEKINLHELMDLKVPGLSISARLYLLWVALLLLTAVFLLFGRALPRLFVESLLAGGLLLALFSWIYALNGDMDYVQRFVATSGLLDIGDTKAERMETLFRYLVPCLLLLGIWVIDALRRYAAFTGVSESTRPSRAGLSLPSVIDVSAPLWAALSAILYSLSLPNFLVLEGMPFLAWFATAPLYLALRQVTYRRGVSLVILFTGLQSLLINWWQGTFSYISLPFTVGLTLVQYLPFIFILTFTVRRFRHYGLLAAPFLWVLWDFLRSLGFLGYPWGILGVSQYAHPAMIQSASLGGVWMVSFLPHFTGAVLAITVERRFFADLYRRWFPLAATVLGVLAIAGAGALGIRINDKRLDKLDSDEYKNLRILIVQQNTDPRKHDYKLSFDELSRLTEEAVAAKGPFDLVAWPESGFVPDIRFWLDEKHSNWRRGKLVRSFLDWQEQMGIPLVTGNQDHFYEPAPPSEDSEAPKEIKRIQNSAVYLPPDRKDDFDRSYYYKMRLVPFTENFPYREQFPWVAELLHNFSTTQWTPGTEHTVLEAPNLSFSTPLCFEDVFPDHLRRFVLAGSEVFVNMSNDYWANTPLEGYQHGAHALFRAVENRRPLVRATCSGWTIAVDTQGRIAEGWPPFYQPGWTVGEFKVPLEPPQTIYNRFGDWFPILCGIIWLGLAIAEIVQFRRRD